MKFSMHFYESSSSSNANILNSKVHQHKGQKEVVLSRPANSLRRHLPAKILDALTKTVNENNQSNQVNFDANPIKIV